MSQTFSTSDVSSHNKPDNLWIIVDEDVYDLSKFQDEHPGMFDSRLRAVIRKANRYQVARKVLPLKSIIGFKSDDLAQSFSESLVKMPRSSSGSTIMRAFSGSTRDNYRSAPWTPKSKRLHRLLPQRHHQRVRGRL